MKTIITKRNYKPLYDLLIILSIYLLIRLYFVGVFKSFDSKLSTIYEQMPSDHSYEFSSNLTEPVFREISSAEAQFGIIVVIASLFIFYNLSKYFKTIKHKFILFLIELSLVFSVFSNTTSELRLNTIDDDNYYISLLIFLPFLFFIYHNSLIGKKVDISDEIKGKTEQLHNEDLNDLDNLFKLNLISKEEYNKKKELSIKEQIRAKVKNSEKYELLLKAKQKGLLTEDEFKIKFEDLVNEKFEKTL